MKLFFLVWGFVILDQAAISAWKSIRRMVRIARNEITMDDIPDMSVFEQKLDCHPAFGDPTYLEMMEVTSTSERAQFFKRWLLYFPMAWVTNVIIPLTWILTLPAAIGLWLIIHFGLLNIVILVCIVSAIFMGIQRFVRRIRRGEQVHLMSRGWQPPLAPLFPMLPRNFNLQPAIDAGSR